MADTKITFAVDQSKLFDALKDMSGDMNPLGQRLVEALLTGGVSFGDAVGMAVYGVGLVEESPMAQSFKVKPLEWWEPREANNYTHGAKTIFGTYYVGICGGRHSAHAEFFHESGDIEQFEGPNRGTLIEAQLDAERHHEARLRTQVLPVAIAVDILTMQMSGDREEHYVRISCGGRSIETRKYDGHLYNRALYERDELRHVLLGHPKPDILESKYADTTTEGAK